MNALNTFTDVLSGAHTLMPLLAMMAKKKPETDVSAHIEPATMVCWIGFAAIFALFFIRPELWRALWFRRVDPRPAALFRMAFGIVVIWTFADLLFLCGEFLFTDQGLWLTSMARKKYGSKLDGLWDPEHGFENWYDIFSAIYGSKFSILHMRSDPTFAYSLFGLLFFSATCMVVGFRTRLATIVTWILALSLYNYSPIYYTGGDTVLKTMMFLAMFVRSGEAYSVDSWLRRRRAILKDGVVDYPLYRKIPFWPMALMMMQSAVIYTATGILKSGSTWNTDLTATYYSMQLDHFYRVPATGFIAWLQWIGILPAGTFLVHWWEMTFGVALIGMGLRGMEKDIARGFWVKAAVWRRALGWLCVATLFACIAYLIYLCCIYYLPIQWKLMPKPVAGYTAATLVVLVPLALVVVMALLRQRARPVYDWILRWPLGKRIWLTFGLIFHGGIDLMLNVGTFPQVTVAPYLVWLSGIEIFAMWRFMLWRAAKPGEAGRPVMPDKGPRRWLMYALLPWHRLIYRVKIPRGTIVVANQESSIRRAALLRGWDLGELYDFRVDAEAEHSGLLIELPGGKVLTGADAGRHLIPACPGLWLLWPLQALPGVARLALWFTGQR